MRHRPSILDLKPFFLLPVREPHVGVEPTPEEYDTSVLPLN